MADDNVSFTDAGDPTVKDGAKGGNSSAMLDLLDTLNKKDDKKKGGKKGKKESKKEKKKGGKTKKVKRADKFESQNFLFRIEGTIFCAAIVVGIVALVGFILVGILFAILTSGNLVSYMQPWWGGSDANTA